MRMRQSIAEIEDAFFDEIEEDRERRENLRRRAERRVLACGEAVNAECGAVRNSFPPVVAPKLGNSFPVSHGASAVASSTSMPVTASPRRRRSAAAGAAASKARANMANRIIETFPVWRRLPALSTACCASIIIRTSRRRPELLSGTTER